MKLSCYLLMLLFVAACAAPKPSEDMFAAAERAIAEAESAGADENAPVEMRFAREKLAEARRGMESREYDVSAYLIEQAEINAELAVAKTQAAKQRQQVSDLQKTVDALEADLQATYGEAFQQ